MDDARVNDGQKSISAHLDSLLGGYVVLLPILAGMKGPCLPESSVLGAKISQAFEDKSLGGFVFFGAEVLGPHFPHAHHLESIGLSILMNLACFVVFG